ncbi:hypothetical protein A9G42_01475 [Gilliamella sp. Nev6-6]|nr:hypothetical protein A9G41_05895 [Gilliamella apicola]OCG79033.1 hypothetical protein A9G42_01475 [Gilliamella apicola]
MNPFTPELIAAFPDDVTACYDKLFWCTVQIGVEVEYFFIFATSFIYTRQWFVAVLVGVDIQAAVLIRAGFLNHF